MRQALALTVIAATFSSCGNQADADDESLMEYPDTIKTSVLNVGGELFSIPSPLQTALLVQKIGLPYDKTMLNATNLVSTYNTDELRALNLGVYGADLGYVSLYSQTQDALGYLASVKQLTDKLGLSAAFDVPTMQRLQNNITNKDSMMTLVSLAYRASDAYLKNNQRAEIGNLILTGGWIESMHFSTKAYLTNSNDQIRYRIAEQKQALSSIIRILDQTEGTQLDRLRSMLAELMKTYDGIGFRYVYEEPKTDSVKKITYINSRTEITVTDEQLKQIGSQVSAIRNMIINSTEKKAG